MKASYALPFILFLFIFIILWRGLSLHPNVVPSPLIGKPAPTFALPSLTDSKRIITEKDFLGHVTLFNVWASWCTACAYEHELLQELVTKEKVIFYGLNYKDKPEAAMEWLKKYGNPYQLIAVDKEGQAAIDWGIYGTPETFVIDKKGIIRNKFIGPITRQVWEENLQPMIKQLENEK